MAAVLRHRHRHDQHRRRPDPAASRTSRRCRSRAPRAAALEQHRASSTTPTARTPTRTSGTSRCSGRSRATRWWASAYVGSYNGRMEYAGRAQAPPAAAIDRHRPPAHRGGARPAAALAAHQRRRSRTPTTSGCPSTTRSSSRCSTASRRGCRQPAVVHLVALDRHQQRLVRRRERDRRRRAAVQNYHDIDANRGPVGLRHPAHPHLGHDLGAAVRARQALAERRRRLLDPRQLAAQLDAARALGPADDAIRGRRSRPTSASPATRAPTWSATRSWRARPPDQWFNTAAFAIPRQLVRQRRAQHPARAELLERGPRPAEERPDRQAAARCRSGSRRSTSSTTSTTATRTSRCGNANFGRITTMASRPRHIQLGLRFAF